MFVFTRFCISFLKNYCLCQTTHTRLTALFLGLYQKGKLKQETVSGSGISWDICKSAPHSRQITTPAPHRSVFTGRMPLLPPKQQRQSTEGMYVRPACCKTDSAQNVNTVVTSTNTSRRHYAVSSCHSLVLVQGLDLPVLVQY